MAALEKLLPYNDVFTGTAALRAAVEVGNERALDILLNGGAEPACSEIITEEDCLLENQLRRVPLLEACERGYFAIVKRLLGHWPHLLKKTEDRMRCTDAELEVLLHAFMYALCHANIDIAKFLSRKTVRKIPRSAGPLLFRHALTQRNAGAVRFLYAKRHQTNRTSCPFSLPNMTGTDNCTLIHSHEYINCTWPDGSILHVIANLYDPDETEFPTEAMADMVLGWGAELEAGGEPMNRSPLHITVEAGDMRLAKYLINRGAAVNSTDYAARSPLFYAVMEADHSMATLLLSREAQVNRRDTDRMTPLHMATSLSDVSMMWLLIEKYAEIDPTDHSANTPLHIAATLEDAGPVKLLLEHGADSQLVNFHGNTPLDIAREMGCKAAKRELKYHLIRAYLRVCVDEILGVSSGLFLRLRYRITSDLCY